MTQRIQAPDGSFVDFPDGMDDAAMAAIMGQHFGGPNLPSAPAAATAEPPTARLTVTKGDAPQVAPSPQSPVQNALRGLQVGTQGTGAGLADTVGMPVDAMTGLINAGIHGFNWLTGTSVPPIEHPFLGSDSIRGAVSKGAEAVGYPVLDRPDMTPKERLGYDIDRFGTQALSSAAPMAAVAAPARMAAIAGGKAAPQMGDALLRPYMTDSAARTVAGDAVAGAGTGVATNAVDDHLQKAPDSPLWNTGVDVARAFAPIMGGAAGSHIFSTVEDLARSIPRAVSNRQAAAGIPLDANNPGAPPVTNKTAEAAARRMQDAASNPPSVTAQNIEDNSAYYRAAGLPQPSVGLISGDTGLNAAETAARTRNGVPFIENDNKMRQAATDRIGSLLDKGADQGAATAKMQAAPGELAGTRDATALPLLQAAEARGGRVDAQPVVDLIDAKLTTAKREPVLNALKNARAKLLTPDGASLDNTVSGLYESRKAINDIIEGRTDNSTGRFAQKELVEVRDALDKQIGAVAPEFGQYLHEFRAGSKPLNELNAAGGAAKALMDGADPRDVAASVFGSNKYGAEKELDLIQKHVASDPIAQRGWKAAVSEHLSNAVSSVAKVDAGKPGATAEGRVELGKLDKMFDNNRSLLAKVYTPDEMNTLQQAHTALAPLANASARGAAGGSNTADKVSNLMRYTELGVKSIKGTLRGGSIMRNIRLAVAMMPNQNAAVDRLLTRAWFDPDIAKRLLTLKTEDLAAPTANAKLRWLQGLAAYGRSSSEAAPTQGDVK